MKFFLQKNSRTPHFTLHFYQINHFECVTFAWFTSKDEVTNRLAASGDYGVRIVESFAPTAQWLPGQEVNKDVYAVNTGDVEAYVKETVSSVLTITTEEATVGTTEPTKPEADFIKLSSAERYVVEAGAFLVYKPEGSRKELGKEVIAMTPGADENGYVAANATDFTPDVEGLYVFRRTIGVNSKTQLEEYTYEAYYFVPGTDATTVEKPVAGTGLDAGKNLYVDSADNSNFGYYTDGDTNIPSGWTKATQPLSVPVDGIASTYYKVGDLSVIPDKATFAGNVLQDDGYVNSDPATPPTYKFYKEVTKTVVPTLEYDADNNRLVATYDTGAMSETDLKALAKAYEDAAIAYEAALEEYRAAVRDEATAAGNLNTGARAALLRAIADVQDAKKNWDDAKDVLEAAKALKAQTAAALAAATTADDAATQAVTAAENTKNLKDQAATQAETIRSGKETVRNDARDARDDARDALNGVPTESRDAFIAYFKANPPTGSSLTASSTDADVEAYFLSLHYEDITTLGTSGSGLDNPNDVKWDYYQKLVTLKAREKDLKDAQDDLDVATVTKNDADQELADATAAYNEAVAEKARTAAEKAAAQTADNDAGADLGDPSNTTAGTAYGDAYVAEQAYNAAMADLAAAQDAYNTSLATSGGASDDLEAAANKLAKATQLMKDTWNAYDSADKADTAKIKIYINLADVDTIGGTANKWQLLPESLEDVYKNTLNTNVNTITKEPDGKTDTASFYYTSILGGGETTAKLIDSVELDKNVTQDMFKYFDFDLNVDLNSVQVTFDQNGNYSTDAVIAENGFNKYAVLTDNTSADTAITWSNTATLPAAAKPVQTFSAKDTTDTTRTITQLSPKKTIDYVDYEYEITDGNKKYYANSTAVGTEFKKYDEATGKLSNATADTITLGTTAAARTNAIMTVTFKNASDYVADTTAYYEGNLSAATWTGTAPAGATKFCATNSETKSDWKDTVGEVLGTPSADGTKTVYYKTE